MTARSDEPKGQGALDGIRVLDLSRILAGPTCTQILGDLGADIIKVERPGEGDDTRRWGPPYVVGTDGEPTSESAYYLAANRNKRSIELDFSTADGKAHVLDLIESSDILVDELFHEIDKWIGEGMFRPKRLKMAKPAALAMAEASAIPLE